MDAGDNPQGASRSRPLSSWKRFRQAQSIAVGLTNESVSTDFHELRKELRSVPPNPHKPKPMEGTHHDVLATPLSPHLGNA